MNLRSGLTLFGLLASLACGGGGGGSSSSYPSTPAGPPPNTVYVGGDSGYGGSDMTFTPSTLTVSAGTMVTFVWKGGTHNVTSYAVSGSPTFTNSGDHSNVGDSFQYTFATAGAYYYRCTYHSTAQADPNSVATGMMIGKVVVQ